MTPKQTALINVAKLVTVAILAGAMTSLAFTFFTIAQIGIAFALAVMAALIKFVYDIELSKAEHLDALNTLNKMK
jgi:hypothetical protein